MNCDRVRSLMPFLHDGSLAPEIAREAGEHVERCESCRAEYAELSRTLSLVRKSLERQVPLVAPVAYREAVMAKIRKRRKERKVVSWAVPVAAAIFLTASISSYSLFHGTFLSGSSTAKKGPTVHQIETMDETDIINTMYHYADVSVYDVLDNMDEDTWEAEAGSEEVDGE